MNRSNADLKFITKIKSVGNYYLVKDSTKLTKYNLYENGLEPFIFINLISKVDIIHGVVDIVYVKELYLDLPKYNLLRKIDEKLLLSLNDHYYNLMMTAIFTMILNNDYLFVINWDLVDKTDNNYKIALLNKII